MDLSEKMVSSQTIFDGKIIKVTLDQAQLPDGTLAAREVVYHPGGVAVLALDEDKTVYLVRQYRYPFQEVVAELPAGKLERGEDPCEAAIRELREETGAVAGTFESLGELYPSPGYCGEIIRMYLARDLTFGGTDLDEDEFLNLERVPFETLVQQVLSGEVRDAKTIAAVLKAKVLQGL